jgi:hypothetical protein
MYSSSLVVGEQLTQMRRNTAQHEPAAGLSRVVESTHDLTEAVAVNRSHLAEIDDDVDATLVDQLFNPCPAGWSGCQRL